MLGAEGSAETAPAVTVVPTQTYKVLDSDSLL